MREALYAVNYKNRAKTKSKYSKNDARAQNSGKMFKDDIKKSIIKI